MTAGKITYELRRLRLHGLIERVPHTNRYQVTSFGLQVAMFFTRTYNRVLRTGLSHICDRCHSTPRYVVNSPSSKP